MLAKQSIVRTDTPFTLKEWTEAHRTFSGLPMRIPKPLHELYDVRPGTLAVMKGAQMGFSEWAINLCLWAADTGYAERGTSLYVQPGGENVGDFVQARVSPVIDESDYLTSRVQLLSRKDPDKVGLRRIGPGYTYWRTAGSRAGLKSVPADVLVLDEFENMPEGVLSLASHRLDSSKAPVTIIISTPEFAGGNMETQYLAGDQRRYFLDCPNCDNSQALEWEKNVDIELLTRVCVNCHESLEHVISAAWEGQGGEWRATNPDGEHRSYHLSQLYRPTCDIAAIHRGMTSANVSLQQETWNQNLGLPYAPPGNQLSLAELQRISVPELRLEHVEGVQGCYVGVDVGTKLHTVVLWDDVNGLLAEPMRYVVGAYEFDTFDEVQAVMRRFGAHVAVVDAHPELHYAQAFQFSNPGRVYLCDYINGRTPPLITAHDEPDPKRRWRVQVDRTKAIDSVFATVREMELRFPADLASVPGFFAQLQAPVRRLKPNPDGNMRAVYEEGSRADHYAHALVYAQLAVHVGERMVTSGVLDARMNSQLAEL